MKGWKGSLKKVHKINGVDLVLHEVEILYTPPRRELKGKVLSDYLSTTGRGSNTKDFNVYLPTKGV